MRSTQSHTINGFVYDITQLGAKEGRIVLAHLLRVVSGAAEAADKPEEAIPKLVSSLSDTEVNFLCDTFAKTTMVGPEGTDNRKRLSDCFDEHFIGRYGDMVRWLWAALETNYSSFFSDLGLSPEGLKVMAANAMSGSLGSPTAPSGASSSPASAASSKSNASGASTTS